VDRQDLERSIEKLSRVLGPPDRTGATALAADLGIEPQRERRVGAGRQEIGERPTDQPAERAAGLAAQVARQLPWRGGAAGPECVNGIVSAAPQAQRAQVQRPGRRAGQFDPHLVEAVQPLEGIDRLGREVEAQVTAGDPHRAAFARQQAHRRERAERDARMAAVALEALGALVLDQRRQRQLLYHAEHDQHGAEKDREATHTIGSLPERWPSG
jgi:hypothetical protein